MKLSFNLTKEGFPPANIDTRCEITLDPDKGIVESRLTVEAKVPGIDKNKFQELVEHAKINCPVSKLLNTSIVCEAELTA
jgi:osmotically inducible protein OsmC